ELETDFDRIVRIAVAEEEAFLRTLNSGLLVLDEEVSKAKGAGESSLSGTSAFLLHDTYGFPIDLTLEIAAEAGLEVDREEFKSLMNVQKQRAKDDAKRKRSGNNDLAVYGEFRTLGQTHFTGYDELETESTVVGLIRDGSSVTQLGQGDVAEIILRETPFYAESGGQDSDSGIITASGLVLEVVDVQKPVKGLISHSVVVKQGEIGLGSKVLAQVSREWRLGAAQAHSATHVLHAALRQVLGSSALQSGSYNKPGYLRLDFAWNEALSQETKSEIETVSNLAIRSDLAVSADFMSIEEAKAFGAIALFGETYDEQVRVIQIGGPWSRELCGGTHVSRSSQVGMVSLTGESSVGSGSRRLEALVGFEAFQAFTAERLLVQKLTESLKVPKEQLIDRIAQTAEELKLAQKKLAAFAIDQLSSRIPEFLSNAEIIGNTSVVVADLGVVESAEQVREIALKIRSARDAESLVCVAFGLVETKIALIATTTQAARSGGVSAGKLVKAASAVLGGGGGGKDDVAQGGGPNHSALPAALEVIRSILRG
ncbi:MAG: alanine--tRNA ligase-related protein, partial [Actinomycetota bacterium]